MSFSLFSYLLTCALVLAFSLLLIDSNDHMDLRLATSLYNMATVAAMTFSFCLVSENITEALFNIGDAFYESQWYFLPVNQQKQLVVTILRSQCKFRLKGLALVYCSLYTFLRVILTLER